VSWAQAGLGANGLTYAFRWYRDGALSGVNRGTPLPFDVRMYDYNPNGQVALGSQYTIPVKGIWHFDWFVASYTPVSSAGWWLFSRLMRGNDVLGRGTLAYSETASSYSLWHSGGSIDVECNAGDLPFIDFNTASSLGMSMNVGRENLTWSGHLVGKT
jgi:hypothetical protein